MKLNKNQRILLIVLIFLVLVIIFISFIDNFMPKKELKLCKVDADCKEGFSCEKKILCNNDDSECIEVNYCEKIEEININNPVCGDGFCDSDEIDRYTRSSCYDQGCRIPDEPNAYYCPEDCE